jgi:hypothetical protein
MLHVVLVGCAVVLTFAAVGLMAAQRRLVEQQITEIVARKLACSREALVVELGDLREENSVMRNLLMDIAENEATAKVGSDLPEHVTTRIAENRLARRSALLGEVEMVLRSGRMVDASM